MNKRGAASLSEHGPYYLGFVICGALFMCGCIAGMAFAGIAGGEADLSEYLSDYIELAGGQAARKPDFLVCMISACKYHMLAIFLGFSVLGVFCAPVLAAVRGFFLCFSVSAVVRLFGWNGALLALAIFGAGAITTIPCLFVLLVQSFSSSLGLFKMVAARGARVAATPYGDGFFRRCCICMAILTCSAVFETLVTPRLISFAASRIL